MSPVPSLPADLHYADREQVELDLDAIIARGGRIRRRRAMAKVAAAAVVCAIAPTVIVTDMPGQAPGQGAGTIAGQLHRLAPRSRHTYNGTHRGPAFRASFGVFSGSYNAPDHAVATADRKLLATMSPRLGPVLAMASTRSADGVWFAAASGRLTLFHLSDQGKLESVRLATPGSLTLTRAGVALAVSSSDVVWVRVSSTLIRYDPRSAIVSSWRVPAERGQQSGRQSRNNYSVAVGPDGNVALATSRSSSVQVLDPLSGRFSDYLLPDATDQPLAVGYAQDGTLGVGYLHDSRVSKVMLIRPSGARLTATVAQSSAVTSYGHSGLLVGTGLPDVVSATGKVRPLVLPAGTRSAARGVPPAVALRGDRLGMAFEYGIVTFPAHAASVAAATRGSELWLVPADRCPRNHACAAGFRLVAAAGAGGVWVTLRADPYAVVLLRLG